MQAATAERGKKEGRGLENGENAAVAAVSKQERQTAMRAKINAINRDRQPAKK